MENKNLLKAKINFIIERHALTCANELYSVGIRKVSAQLKINEYAEDTDISNIGIQQCLQLSDFLKKSKENNSDYINGNAIGIGGLNNNQPDPITIFCCSELRRTNETLYASFLNYMPDYLSKNRIIILPWLNERSHFNMDKDNIPESLEERRKNWGLFIKNFKKFLTEKYADFGQTDNNIFNESINKMNDKWDDLFYLPESVYKIGGNPFVDDGKKIKIGIKKILEIDINIRKFLLSMKVNPTEIYSSVADMNELFNGYWLNQILMDYLKKFHPDVDLNRELKINLVMVTHSGSGIELINTIMKDKSKVGLEKQQLVNCELIKLPISNVKGEILDSTEKDIEFSKLRLFPVGFYDSIIKVKGFEPYVENSIKRIYRFYIFYIASFNLFYSFYNVSTQKTYYTLRENNMSNEDIISNHSPLLKFINMSYKKYLKDLPNLIETLNAYIRFYGDNVGGYYNYIALVGKADGIKNELDKVINEFVRIFEGMEIGRNNFSSLLENKKNGKNEIRKEIRNMLRNRSDKFINKVFGKNPVGIIEKISDKIGKKDDFLTIKEIYGMENLHKYFFDGCKSKLKYLCKSCVEEGNTVGNEFSNDKPFFT